MIQSSLTHSPAWEPFSPGRYIGVQLGDGDKEIANPLGLSLPVIRSTERRFTEPHPSLVLAAVAVLRVLACCWNSEPRPSSRCTWLPLSMRRSREVNEPAHHTQSIGGLAPVGMNRWYSVHHARIPQIVTSRPCAA